MAKKITVTQIRSAIKQPERQKKVLEALGLRKLNVGIEKEANPEIMGMIRKVAHLVKVEDKK